MGWATAISAGLQVGSSLFGANQGRKAADANKKASQQSMAEWQRARDQAQGYQQPYADYGQGAGGLGGLQALAGGDYSALFDSPEFKSRVMFANQQANNSDAARFRLFSGGAQNDRDELNQNLAAQGMGQLVNRLQWGAGLGQHAASASAGYGMDAARGISNGLQGVADAANQRAGVNAGLGNSLANIGGQFLPSAFGGGSGGSGLSSAFGMPTQGSGNNPYYTNNWTSGNWYS